MNFIARFDDSQITRALERLADGTNDVQADFDRMGREGSDAFSQVGKAVQETEKNMAGLTQKTMKQKERTAAATREQSKFTDALKGTVREIQIGGKSIGEWVDGLNDTKTSIRGVTASIGGTNKALRAFKIALASTGVGLIIVALGSLAALLTKTQKGIDFVNRIMAQLSTTINVIVDRLAVFGEGVVQLFQGEFSTAVDTFRGSVAGLGDELARENEITRILERDKVKLRDRQRELNVEFAEGRARIEELRLAAEDESKSIGERRRALEESIRLEQEFGRRRVDLAEENLRIIATENALTTESQANLDRLADAEIALAEIREDVAGKQQEDFAAVQQLIREEQQRIAALRAEYNKFLDELEARAEAADLSRLTGLEKLQAEKELALQEVRNFAKEVEAAATAAGLELPETFNADIIRLVQAVEDQFRREVDKLKKNDDIKIEPIDLLGGKETDFKEEGKKAAKALAEGMESGTEESMSILDGIKLDIMTALDINQAQLDNITSNIGTTFENVTGLIDETTQAAINQQDRVIDALDQRISETERLLTREQRLQEQGFANDVAGLERKLAEETEARRKAEEERLELEKRAAKQRLFQNSLEQASNLVLATLKLTAAEAGKGIVGVFTALAGLSLIARIVAQSKSISKQFEPPKLREGTPWLVGPSHEGGGIPVEAEGGERVISRKLNEKVGRKVDNEQMVKLYLLGKSLRESLAGKTAIPGLVEQARRGQQRREELSVNIPYEIMAKAYREAAQESAGRMIDYWKTRPVEWIDGAGNKVVERHDGGRIERRKIKAKQ